MNDTEAGMIAMFDEDFAGPGEWASLYRSVGIQVVPAYQPDPKNPAFAWKRPLLKEWKSYQNDIIPDFTFERWYGPQGEHMARANMGIVTGKCSGNIGVVDLDIQKIPAAIYWWRGLLQEHNSGIEPETWRQTTGGGGIQILFRFPADFVVPTVKTAIGVDIRGQGGFAMLPPSRHESGRAYDWQRGFSPHEILVEDAPLWLCEAILQLAEEHGGTPTGTRERTASTGSFDDFGNRTDGREEAMSDLIWARLIDLRRECPIPPPDTEMTDAFAVYARTNKTRLTGVGNEEGLEREGRGLSEFVRKWRRTLEKWETDIAAEAGKAPLEKSPLVSNEAPPEDIYPTLDLAAIDALPPPTWLIDKILPEGALTFVYGPPGKGKSFFVLDMALRIAHGFDWHGFACKQGGVLYIAGEGKGGFRNRSKGWHMHHGLVPDLAPFRLLPASIDFMDEPSVVKLIRTIKAVIGDAKLVIIDTVARALPGADENASKEMGLFVNACLAVQTQCNVAVIGVHHSGKDVDRGMRGSSSLEGAGDCIIMVKRDEQSPTVELVVDKQKEDEKHPPIAFTMKKIEWSEGVLSVSTLVPERLEAGVSVAQKSKLPDEQTCRRILNAISEAWFQQNPWSVNPQAKTSGRHAATNVHRGFDVEYRMAEFLLEEWQRNGVVRMEKFNSKNASKGLKVL